jgi:hypothetical protein
MRFTLIQLPHHSSQWSCRIQQKRIRHDTKALPGADMTLRAILKQNKRLRQISLAQPHSANCLTVHYGAQTPAGVPSALHVQVPPRTQAKAWHVSPKLTHALGRPGTGSGSNGKQQPVAQPTAGSQNNEPSGPASSPPPPPPVHTPASASHRWPMPQLVHAAPGIPCPHWLLVKSAFRLQILPSQQPSEHVVALQTVPPAQTPAWQL